MSKPTAKADGLRAMRERNHAAEQARAAAAAKAEPKRKKAPPAVKPEGRDD